MALDFIVPGAPIMAMFRLSWVSFGNATTSPLYSPSITPSESSGLDFCKTDFNSLSLIHCAVP